MNALNIYTPLSLEERSRIDGLRENYSAMKAGLIAEKNKLISDNRLYKLNRQEAKNSKDTFSIDTFTGYIRVNKTEIERINKQLSRNKPSIPGGLFECHACEVKSMKYAGTNPKNDVKEFQCPVCDAKVIDPRLKEDYFM